MVHVAKFDPITYSIDRLGEVMKTEPYSVADVGNLDFKDSPHATFIFKYCSKSKLSRGSQISGV